MEFCRGDLWSPAGMHPAVAGDGYYCPQVLHGNLERKQSNRIWLPCFFYACAIFSLASISASESWSGQEVSL